MQTSIDAASTLQPLGAFNADVFARLVFTDTVQPAAVTAVRAPLTLAPGISEGSKVLRVRIGQVGPTGQLVIVLDERVVSGQLRVERPLR